MVYGIILKENMCLIYGTSRNKEAAAAWNQRRWVFKRERKSRFFPYASKVFKLLVLPTGFHSHELIGHLFTWVVWEDWWKQKTVGLGWRRVRTDEKMLSCLQYIVGNKEASRKKITYLFIEAREKTRVLKMESCKCELF